jgi:mannosyltransferase
MSRATELLSRHALLWIIAVGALLRFSTIGIQDFWLDEIVTVQEIGLPPIDILKQVNAADSNPVLYPLLAGGWERVFGSGEWGVRSLPALLGTLTIPLVYAATKTLASRRAGLIAAGLTATNPLLVWYSGEARNYSLLVFCSALAFLCFARAMDEVRGLRWLWAWALASALALTTHYYALLLIAPMAAWLLWRRPGSRLDTLMALGVIGVVGLALSPHVAARKGGTEWIDDIDLSERLIQLPEHFLVGFWSPWEALPLIAVVAALGVAIYAAVGAEPRTARAIAIAASIALAPLLILLIVAFAGDDYIVTRYLLELWVPFAVALAAALGAAAVGRLGAIMAVGLCVLGGGLVIWTALTSETHRPGYDDLAAEIGPAGEERLIVSQTSFSLPLTWYLEGTTTSTDPQPTASELVVVAPKVTDDYSVGPCWWILTCGGTDHDPVPAFVPPPEFELSRHGSTEDFDYAVFTADRPTTVERPFEFPVVARVFVQQPG